MPRIIASSTGTPARGVVLRTGTDEKPSAAADDAGPVHEFDIPDIPIERRRYRPDPIDDRKLRRALADKTWTRVTAGAFTRTSDWASLTPIQQHRLRTAEVARRRRAPVVISHFAAAAMCDVDVLGDWPERIDVTVPTATGGRSSGLIRRRFGDVDAVATMPFGLHRVTRPDQTALDLARILPFAHGVAVIDQAIHSARVGGGLTTPTEIRHLLEAAPHPGDTRAKRAIAFAHPLAANVRESQLRVVVNTLGFPHPRVQERRVLRSGRLVFGDLYFPEQDHWLELDGRGKYTSPEFTNGRTTAEIVLDEKARENEIRREVGGFSRLEPSDLNEPRRLYDILTSDGLRASRARP